MWYDTSAGRYGKNGEKGDRGADLVEEYFKRHNISYERKEDRFSQTVLKIDFEVEGVLMDVKTNIFKDYHAVEIKKKNNNTGWLYETKAKEIYAVDLEKKRIFVYNIEDMIKYANKNNNRYKLNKYGDTILWVSIEEKLFKELLWLK